MSDVFSNIAGLTPKRSVFDLSYVKTLTCDMGQLIPVMCDEVVPGDIFKIGNEAVVRFQPMVAPILHEVNLYTHYFFVPYRLLWDDWEDFISGGTEGDDASVLPRWNPTNKAIGSLWDYLGFPTTITPTGRLPLSFPREAYNFIFSEYYRDQTLQESFDWTAGNEDILNRCWEKDYFTSSLPWQQRGVAPALPVSGATSAVWSSDLGLTFTLTAGSDTNNTMQFRSRVSAPPRAVDGIDPASNTGIALKPPYTKISQADMNNNTVDLSTATTVDIADLRLAIQLQKWMERNARAGVRYTEFLRAHFGVSPRDERLSRPEYIGGSKSPVIFSEVLQTSSTDATTPQGNLAGHGVTVSVTQCGQYRAQEYGLIMGIMSVMPRTMYQQGINRQWLRQTKYDFYFPEFACLSEQAVERVEVYATAVEADNKTLFGYQGRYNEMRYKPSMVVGQMRDTFDYWHLGRKFTAAPELNESFVKCVPTKRIFAVETDPGLIVSFGNRITAIRPMPVQAEPGLMDHF